MIYAALVGLTLIIVRGTIFRPLQRLYPPLLQCAQCTGAWIGIGACALGLTTFDAPRVVDEILVGGAVSLLSMGVDAVLLKLLGDPTE